MTPEEQVAEIAQVIGEIDGDPFPDLSPRAQDACRRAAAALVDAGIGSTAEVHRRFRVAAELTVQDVRAQRGDHIAGLVEDSFAAHFARADR